MRENFTLDVCSLLVGWSWGADKIEEFWKVDVDSGFLVSLVQGCGRVLVERNCAEKNDVIRFDFGSCVVAALLERLATHKYYNRGCIIYTYIHTKHASLYIHTH